MEHPYIHLQCLKIHSPEKLTLNELQKLLGNINWLQPSFGTPIYALTHLFNTLKGVIAFDSESSAHRQK